MSHNIPFENFENIHQDIPRAFSLHKMKLITFAFIPKRLEVFDRPELNDFPRSILFANTVQLGRYGQYRLSLYEPDLSTYMNLNGQQQMLYRNAHGGNSQVKVLRHEKGYYSAAKVFDGVENEFASGESWKSFFLYLSLLGRHQDEAGVEVLGGEILYAYPPKP